MNKFKLKIVGSTYDNIIGNLYEIGPRIFRVTETRIYRGVLCAYGVNIHKKEIEIIPLFDINTMSHPEFGKTVKLLNIENLEKLVEDEKRH